ncbi:DUF5819 family protein [Cellulomonas sp. NPDC055163]
MHQTSSRAAAAAGVAPTARQRRVARAALAVAVAHAVVTVLWVGGSALGVPAPAPVRAWVLPLFAQSWNLFAPDPFTTESELWVRGRTCDGATTPWRSPTREEWSLVEGSPAPVRAGRLTTNLATELDRAHRALPQDVRTVLASDRPDADARQELAEDLGVEPAELGTPLALGSRTGLELAPTAADALRLDEVAAGYATQHLAATSATGPPCAVQTQVRSVPIGVPARTAPDDAGLPRVVVDHGWRPATVQPGQSSDAFADALRRWVP